MYPALAVLSALGERAEVLWVGGQGGMEATLVQRAGIPFEAIPAAGLHGVGLRAMPGNLMRLAEGIPAASRILKRFNPDVLFFTGGYVGVPVAVAGRKRPQAVFVPDVEPGLALRWITRLADVIMVSTERAKEFYSRQKQVLVTGYPTRSWMEPTPAEDARVALNLDREIPVVLIFGGSRGARSINEAVWSDLPRLLESCQVLHITGELDWPRVSEFVSAFQSGLTSRYHAQRYLHEEMALAMSAADLVVSRAGAATMGEFPRFGLPAILVPYPHAWRYQQVNAAYLREAGGAVVLEDELLKGRLVDRILELLANQESLKQMGQAMHALDRPKAADRIANAITELAAERSEDNG
ncbi:MAG: UDP-N-acetylglucosamine--N-acetylmuramyl-(pentapeptide) pyrophosphoryl-undecaprenol N-acetylglucosamine transferase [Anaerolineales bacterium]